MIDVMPATPPSRRDLMRAGGLALAVVTLGGCSGERLRTPWSPDPTGDAAATSAPPDSDLLLAARARVARYRDVLGQVAPESSGQRETAQLLERLWAMQQDRLDHMLTLSGVDLPDVAVSTADPAATTGATGADDAATTSEGPGIPPLDLAREVREGLAAATAEVARSTATHRAVLVSLAAQHSMSAGLLGATVEWPELAGPTGAAAVPVLAATRPAVFGLEVVAARSAGEERDRYAQVLAAVQSATRHLTTLAGDAAPVPPLGYDLPEPLASADERRDLARALVGDIAPAVLSVAVRTGAAEDQAASLVRLVADATRWGRRLGRDDDPFPGMTLP